MVISKLIIFPKEINLSILIEVVKEVALRGLKIHTHTCKHTDTQLHTHTYTDKYTHAHKYENKHTYNFSLFC